jgi:hypothetical protein
MRDFIKLTIVFQLLCVIIFTLLSLVSYVIINKWLPVDILLAVMVIVFLVTLLTIVISPLLVWILEF